MGGTDPRPIPGAKISFSSFKQSFASTTSYLRRRFSSGDLSGELDDQERRIEQEGEDGPTEISQSQEPDLALHVRQGTTISAPTSPSKNVPAFQQRANSVTTGSAVKAPSAKDKHKTVLVIDDQHTDWSKYFRGKRIHGDWDIRMEQAEFKDINLSVNSDSGAIVSMVVNRNGTKVVRSFRPDFLLIRQHVRDAGHEDYRNLLLGFKYGGVPSVNSLHSLYNFQDKPWVFSQLLHMQRRLGKENFPLIEQSYFPNHKEMVSLH
ncbi:synapsin [Trichonephila clavata]|uniref:Synapsin n=1 Tax=Trichonephila clavata TaxID=2740835 RepID=A0A8X6HHU2_TRICU|nr:synapsin [Trichonephila clavata]